MPADNAKPRFCRAGVAADIALRPTCPPLASKHRRPTLVVSRRRAAGIVDRCAADNAVAPLPSEAASLLADHFAGATEFSGKILQLGQTVSHRQHRLGIVDVNTG